MPNRRLQLEKQLQTQQLTDDERQNILQALERKERDFTRLQRQRMSAADFELLTIIGRGAFGEVSPKASYMSTTGMLIAHRQSRFHVLQVRLCRQKTSGKVYAMKKLKKAEMVRRGQVSLRQCKAKCQSVALKHNRCFYVYM